MPGAALKLFALQGDQIRTSWTPDSPAATSYAVLTGATIWADDVLPAAPNYSVLAPAAPTWSDDLPAASSYSALASPATSYADDAPASSSWDADVPPADPTWNPDSPPAESWIADTPETTPPWREPIDIRRARAWETEKLDVTKTEDWTDVETQDMTGGTRTAWTEVED